MEIQLGRLVRGFVLLMAMVCTDSRGADPEVLGLLALATDTDIAAELALSDEQKQQLEQLKASREELARGTGDPAAGLEGDARFAALRPFRIESQRLMAAILTNEQLQKLSSIGAAEGNAAYEPVDAPATTALGSVPEATREFAEQVTAPPPGASEEGAEQEPAEVSSQPGASRSRAVLQDEPAENEAEALPAEADEEFVPTGRLRFNFKHQPWEDVLEWFAEQADLSMVLESPPSGVFNYTDSKSYEVDEALDILNSVLLVKGYTLVRKGRMLFLVNFEAEGGVPPNLISDISLAELEERAEYELVRVLFRVRNMSPAVAAEEVQKLVGPQGSVEVLPRAGMIQVVETAGRLRKIRDVIEAVEGPEPTALSDVKPFNLEYAAATEVFPIVRQMLGIPAEGNQTPDNTLHVTVDSITNSRLLARGTPEMLLRLKEILELVDTDAGSGGIANSLQLEVYSTGQSDPDAVLLVLQALLAETPGTRLTVDPQTGNVVALATPASHGTIRATLAQMQQDVRQVEVIPLRSVEPQLAVLQITKLFNIKPGEDANPRQPVIDADLSSRSLLVRASKSQIEQIRELLSKMGETEESSFSASDQGNVRLLPFTASETRAAMDQLNQIWPTLRTNPLQLVKPATAIRAFRPAEIAPHTAPAETEDFDWTDLLPGLPRIPQPQESQQDGPAEDSEARGPIRRQVPVREAVWQQAEPSEQTPNDSNPAQVDRNELAPRGTAGSSESSSAIPPRNRPGAPIYVAPGPNGLMIASEDLEALNDFERLLDATMEQSVSATREYAVFYLRHAKAPAAAAILAEIFGGTSGGGGDGLLGGIADAALGDIGGGLMGDLLGLGGGGGTVGGFTSASVDIVTDTRLNALIVYGRSDDIETVNRLLQVIDQRLGPTDIEADGVSRLIPVVYRSAADVAEIVKSQFADRIEGGPGGQPNPEELLRALRGGGQGGASDAQEPSKMSISVDERSNSVVVRAPDSLFNQVEALVHQLDTQQEDSAQATQIISLRHSNLEAVKAALGPIASPQTTPSSQTPTPGAQGGGGPDPQEIQRRQEFFRRLIEQGRGGGGDRGRGDRGGRGGRGGDRGGGRDR